MKKIYLISILITLFVVTCNSALAESSERYCISKLIKNENHNIKYKEDSTEDNIPSFINDSINIPKLYNSPCTKFSRFFDECTSSEFYSYSPTLNLVFIQGHRKTNWSEDFVHLEISPLGTKSVPNELVDSGFLKDSPSLNGALFMDYSKREPLFYDGEKVTNLTQYFPDSEAKAKSKFNGWRFVETSAQRAFMFNVSSKYKGQPFLMEFKPGLNFSFISIPKNFDGKYLRLFTPFNDSRLWGLTYDSIFTEIDGKLQNVLTIASPFNTVGSGFIEHLADGSISFYIRNNNNRSSETLYLLRQYLSQTD